MLLSRRKSVSFAVCTLDEDTMSFNIERKSVFLGDPNAKSSSQNLNAPPPLFVPTSPLLVHMANKWRAVTGRKSKKRPKRALERGISIRASAASLGASRPASASMLATGCLASAAGSMSMLTSQQQQPTEVIEIYDENGQLVSGKRTASVEINETQM